MVLNRTVALRLARAGALALLALFALWPAAGHARTVTLGQIDLSFYAVSGEVVRAVLERLGHRVAVRRGLHGDLYPALGRGEIDLLNAAWLPHAHRPYWEAHGDRAVELATLYEGARLYWAVPAYVPEAMVAGIADLARPAVAARMDTVIQGTGPGSGLMKRSARVMAAYGLDQAGYRLRPGSQAEWLAHFRDAHAAGRWAVLPMGQPRFLTQAYDLRMLAEPKGLLGEANRAVLVAHERFTAAAPARTLAVLGRISLGLEAVARMDHMVNVEGLDARQAARAWMAANAARVESWF